MDVIISLSGAALVERGQANVAWVKANMPALIAAAAPTQQTFADKLSKAVKIVAGRRRQGRFIAGASAAERSFGRRHADAVKRFAAGRRPMAKSG